MNDDLDEVIEQLGDHYFFEDNLLQGDQILRCIRDTSDTGDRVGDYTLGTLQYHIDYYVVVCTKGEYIEAYNLYHGV